MDQRNFPIALVLTLVLAVPTTVAAAPGEVMAIHTTPEAAPTGATFDGELMWVADRLSDQLYGLDPATGEVARTLPAPGFRPLGLAWDGEALWVVSGEQGRILRLDPDSGLTTHGFEAPTPSPQGLAWDGEYLWLSDDRRDEIMQISTVDGTTVASFPAPSGSPQGLAFDGTYLWCADRIDDRVYMIEPEQGRVILSLEAPGEHARGLAWDGEALWNADYQSDVLFRIDPDLDGPTFVVTEAEHQRLELIHELRNNGPGRVVSADVWMALPSDLPYQTLDGEPIFEPEPDEVVEDRWGQRSAHWRLRELPLAERVRHTMIVDVKLHDVRWFVDPARVGSLEDIPAEITALYLGDEDKYRIHDPVIQRAVSEAVGDETNPYWILRAIHSWVGEQLEYEMVGGWNVAPAVLERGTGSCSEYTFVFIAMCRAAGLPARYVGGSLVRGDAASTDTAYHRWPEIYLPGYGWVPADPQAGDTSEPAKAADTIGHIPARALVTTIGGGGSEHLGWGYNHNEAWTARGPVEVTVESMGEWSPLGDD